MKVKVSEIIDELIANFRPYYKNHMLVTESEFVQRIQAHGISQEYVPMTDIAPVRQIELEGNIVYLDLILVGSIVEEPDGLKFKTDCYDVLCSDDLRSIADKLDSLNIGLSGVSHE